MFYVYDGSFEGFLSAVTVIMRTIPDIAKDNLKFFGIIKRDEIPPLLQYQDIPVIPDITFSFGNYISNNFGEAMTKTIYHAFLSETDGIENAITEYIYLARKQRLDPIDQLYNDSVRKVSKAAMTVTREAHHYLGLLRFRKINPNANTEDIKLFRLDEQTTSVIPRTESHLAVNYSAPYNTVIPRTKSNLAVNYSAPYNTVIPRTESNLAVDYSTPYNYDDFSNIKANCPSIDTFNMPLEIFIADCEPVTCALPLVAEHFVERLPNQNFLIFDRKRKFCVIHEAGGKWTLHPYDDLFEENWQYEKSFEHLWQIYFKSLAIPERINPKLQKSNMPKRYWKYLIETPGGS